MPDPSTPEPEPNPPGTVSDPDAPPSFGPDAPNVRDDDPQETQGTPEAPPPSPPAEPLDEGDFAPDET